MPSRRSTPPSRGTPSPATIARRLYGAYFDRLTDEEKVNAAIADFGDAHAAERAFMTFSRVSCSYCIYCLQVSTSLGNSSWRCLSNTSMFDRPWRRCVSGGPGCCRW